MNRVRADGCVAPRAVVRVLVAALVLAAVGAGLAAAGPATPPGAPAAGVQAWVTHSLDNVMPDRTPPAKPLLAFEWMAARGEMEGGQIVLRGTKPFMITGVEFDPLVHEGKRTEVPAVPLRSAVVGTVRLAVNSSQTPAEMLLRKAPADFPDPFLEGSRHEVGAGVSRPVYVAAEVPRDAVPGQYRGAARVQVEGQGGARGQVVVPVRLTVVDVTLPPNPSLRMTCWVNPANIASWHDADMWSDRYWDLLRVYAREMVRHRQTMLLVPLETIQMSRDRQGQIRFDFSRFDRWAVIAREEGIQTLEIAPLATREHGLWEDKQFIFYPFRAVERHTGERVRVTPAQMASAIQGHLEEKGWLENAVLHVADEPAPFNVASWRELSRIVHAAAPKLKRFDATWVPPSEVKGDLEIQVPLLNLLDTWRDQFAAAQKEGAEVWGYLCWLPQGKYPNRLIDLPLIRTRAIPWVVYSLGATGYMQWGFNFRARHNADERLAPGDNWIVYPGADGPCSSLRWEALRDGLEDHELLCLLRSRSPEKAKAFLSEVVRSATDFETDPVKLEASRRKLLAALLQTAAP